MIIYLITFTLTILCCKMVQNKNKCVSIFFLILVVFIPTILASARANVIGTDVNTYVIPQLKLVQGKNFFEYISNSNIEIGFAILIYFSSILLNDYHIVLFLIQFIMSILIVKIAYSQRENVSMSLTMIVYFLFIYNNTLNAMRQGIAILFVIYSLLKFKDKQYIKSILLFIIAKLFHNSTILYILAYLILYIIDNTKYSEIKKRKIISFIIILLLIFCFVFKSITLFLVRHGIIPYKYYAYINIYTLKSTDIGIFESIFKLIFIILLYYAYKLKNDKLIYFSLIMLICDFIFFSLSSKVTIMRRISYFYSMTGMLIGAPYILKIFKQDKFNRLIGCTVIISILFFYWYRIFIKLGFGETYPYVSDIVKIFNL